MIKEKTYYIAVCDKCGEELKAEATSMIVARDLAAANGWKTIINEEGVETHLCAKCGNGIKKTWYYGG